MNRTLCFLAPLLVALAGTAQAAVIIDYTTWGGGNTALNNGGSLVFTVTMNGDGTVSVVENQSALDVDGTGGSSSIAVTGTTTSTATGSFTIEFNGTEDDLDDTTVQIRSSGLGVVGRNAGRIDYNIGNGGVQSEVMDINVDASSLSGADFLVTELGFGNYQNSSPALVTDFSAGETTVATGTSAFAAGGAAFTVAGGGTGTMLLSVPYDTEGPNARGYSLTTFSFDVVDASVIPEPASAMLFISAIGAFFGMRRRVVC